MPRCRILPDASIDTYSLVRISDDAIQADVAETARLVGMTRAENIKEKEKILIATSVRIMNQELSRVNIYRL